jgi:glycosyltransferase involved in cell wall biosynthesis
MKIGMITHYMPPHTGGIECVAESLFTAYADRGCEVRWIASRAPAGAVPQEGGRVRVPCCNLLEDRLGVPLPLWGPVACREVKRLATWADVLHVHDCLYPGSVLAAALGPALGTPVLLSQHVGFIHYRLAALEWAERVAYATLGRWVLRRASRLVSATPAAEAYMTALLGGHPANAVPVPNGVDTVRFHPANPRERAAARERLGLEEARPVVLFVGRLVEKKGVDLVLAASRQLPEAQFLLVGDGPLAATIPKQPHLVWRPSISADSMHECYHAADCFLLPSHGEGLPLAVQEAAACGLPIVVSEGELYSGPLAELGVCITAARSPGAIAGQVREALSAAKDGQGERARGYAEAHWSIAAMADRYLSLLEEAAFEKRRAILDGQPC